LGAAARPAVAVVVAAGRRPRSAEAALVSVRAAAGLAEAAQVGAGEAVFLLAEPARAAAAWVAALRVVFRFAEPVRVRAHPVRSEPLERRLPPFGKVAPALPPPGHPPQRSLVRAAQMHQLLAQSAESSAKARIPPRAPPVTARPASSASRAAGRALRAVGGCLASMELDGSGFAPLAI